MMVCLFLAQPLLKGNHFDCPEAGVICWFL